jgi:hypothetical protein
VQVKVGWRFESQSWIDVDPLRLQNPYILMEYALRSTLRNHKDFKWISEYTDSPANMFKLVRVFKANTDRNAPKYKFGIEVPCSIPHASQLGQMNGDQLWKEAMGKELQQIGYYKTFCLLQIGETLADYTWIPYQMVFDVKFDLCWKARLVDG